MPANPLPFPAASDTVLTLDRYSTLPGDGGVRELIDRLILSKLGARHWRIELEDRTQAAAVPLCASDDLPGGTAPLIFRLPLGNQVQLALTCIPGAHPAADPDPENWAGVLARLAFESTLRRQAQEENEKIVLSIGEGIMAVDCQARVIFANPVARELLGVEEQAVVGIRIDTLVPQLPFAEWWTQLCGQNGGLLRQELVLPGTTVRELALALTPIGDPQRPPSGAIISIRDIRKEKEVERLRQEFLTTVSHEFCTPLTSIKSFSELLLTYGDSDEATRREFLGIINRESDTLHRLVSDALAMSKLETNTVEWRLKTCDLAEILQDSITDQTAHFQAKNITLQTEWEPGSWPVHADAQELKRAIDKLVHNAAKFSYEGKAATIKLTRGAGGYCLTVENEGEPIPRGDEETIFQKFKQGRDILKNKADGLGLGLPIARRILEHHHGTIRVDKSRTDRTVFVMEIPLAQTPERKAV